MRQTRQLFILGICVLLSSQLSFSQSSSEVLSDHLIAHYRLNNDVTDNSGNEWNGVNEGAVPTTDQFGNESYAYYFSGNGERIQFPAADDLKPSFPFTVSLWFSVSEFNNASASMLYNSDAVPDLYSGFWVSYLADGRVSAGYGNAQGYGAQYRYSVHSNNTVEVGEWYHLVAVFKGERDIDMYLNCKQEILVASGGAYEMVYAGGTGMLGRSYSTVDAFHVGKIDEVKLFDTALSSGEIGRLCNFNEVVTSTEEIVFSDETPYEESPIDEIPMIDVVKSGMNQVNVTNHGNTSIQSYAYSIEGKLLSTTACQPGVTTVDYSNHQPVAYVILIFVSEEGERVKTLKLMTD